MTFELHLQWDEEKGVGRPTYDRQAPHGGDDPCGGLGPSRAHIFFDDTVFGFDQSAGDRIHLVTDTVANAVANSTLVNSGHDMLITLSDGSTILLSGVSHIDSTVFA